jgi:hypothetical protein
MNWKSVFVFFLGFFSCAFLIFVFNFDSNVPFGTGLSVAGLDLRDSVLGRGESAPSDWIKEEDIIVLDDRIILRIEGASLSSYADSGSMVPVFDKGANGIRAVPLSADSIDVGDIVSFRIGDVLVVHRVVEKSVDKDGVYFLVKGDANLVGDGKIRFEDIEYVTVGVLY